jgi:hypothetical protein
MSKLRSAFLHALAWVVLPLCLLGFRVAAKGRGAKRRRVGKLTFWGDSGFLELCELSLERLGTLDPEARRDLTMRRWVWVVQDLQSVGDAPPRIFGISPSYTVWRSDGVIARLVYVAFSISARPPGKGSQEELRERQARVMKSSRSWLEVHGFPEELAACFVLSEGPV